MLSVLAPNHVGLTTRAAPSLFWYQSRPTRAKLEFTIVEDNKPEPVLTVSCTGPLDGGFHRVRLSEHQLQLQLGVEYRWTVALVLDEQNRSKDVVASGVIKRIKPFVGLKQRLENAASTDLPFIYAEEGIWYDAIEVLGDLIGTRPNDWAFYRQRAALLEQVRLPEAAAFDQEFARNLDQSPASSSHTRVAETTK